MAARFCVEGGREGSRGLPPAKGDLTRASSRIELSLDATPPPGYNESAEGARSQNYFETNPQDGIKIILRPMEGGDDSEGEHAQREGRIQQT